MMKIFVRPVLLLLATAFAVAACSDAPAKRDPYNDADSQRSRAHQTQGELSSETK